MAKDQNAGLRLVEESEKEAANAASNGTDNGLTIEQLAMESGMTVRNIRSHRARGLLPPPEVRDRVGYYGEEHLTRLRLIQDLQADGFNLRGIERLLDTAPATQQFLNFKRALSAPMGNEEPQVYTRTELVDRFGAEDNPDILEKAMKAGALAPIGHDRFEARAPSLLEAAEAVVAQGVPVEHAVAAIEKVRRSAEDVAKSFIRLFMQDVWKPFEEDGYPEEKWDDIVEALNQLRPISMQVLSSIYGMTMSDEIDRAFGKELERLSKSKR